MATNLRPIDFAMKQAGLEQWRFESRQATGTHDARTTPKGQALFKANAIDQNHKSTEQLTVHLQRGVPHVDVRTLLADIGTANGAGSGGDDYLGAIHR